MAISAKTYSSVESRFGFNAITLALHPNRRIAYLGRQYSSHRQRLNLGVLRLDDARSEPTWWRDGLDDLPIGCISNAYAICVHPSLRRLYLLSYLETDWNNGQPKQHLLTLLVYTLDAAGEITSGPRVVDGFPAMKTAAAMVAHPVLNKLYVGGNCGPANFGIENLHVLDLNAEGEPLGTRRAVKDERDIPYEARAAGLAMRSDGSLLYVGVGAQRLDAVPLDAEGWRFERGRIQTRMFAGDDADPGLFRSDGLRFHLTPRALFPHYERARNGDIVMLPLDATGMPSAGQRSVSGYPSRTVVASGDGTALWLLADATFEEAYSRLPVPCGVTLSMVSLDSNGDPIGPRTVAATMYGRRPVGDELGAGGAYYQVARAIGDEAVMVYRNLVELGRGANEVRDYSVRCTVTGVEGAIGPRPRLQIMLGTLGAPADVALGAPVDVNETSEAISLDRYLRDRSGPVLMKLTVVDINESTRIFDRLEVRIDVLEADPLGALREVRPGGLVETVAGGAILFLVPGYGFMPPEANRAEQVKLLSQQADQYVDASTRVQVAPSERPQKFMIGCNHILGGQGHLGQLRSYAESMVRLGINTCDAYDWGGIPRAKIDETLIAAGMTWLEKAQETLQEIAILGERVATPARPVNMPPYFDFYLKNHDAALTQWARYMAERAWIDSGGSAASVVKFAAADEPSWGFDYDHVGESGDWIRSGDDYGDFRDYLRRVNPSPEYFGELSWDLVMPWGSATLPRAIEDRRLFYWTMRFLVEEYSRGLERVAERLQEQFGATTHCYANFNNSGWHFWDHDSTQTRLFIKGGPDWFDVGRRSPRATIWSEDWFHDSDAQRWSVKADMMRCARQLGARSMGAYVIGQMLSTPAGASYKVLALIGRGAKLLDFYTWGPGHWTGDAWSEHIAVYESIANATRLVGRAEHLLFPGEPPRGRVAIHASGASRLWDYPNANDALEPIYLYEPGRLHTALVHEGYSVDFVDDIDLAGGALESRGYSVLYLTSPNMSAAAQASVVVWVKRGGVVAAVPGAAVANELDEPTETISGLLGLAAGRSAVRSEQRLWLPDGQSLSSFDDPTFGNDAVPLVAMTATAGTNLVLTPGNTPALRLAPVPTLTVGARLSSGGAAITINRQVSGKAIAYAFFPGHQYDWSPTRGDLPASLRPLPSGWGRAQRRLAVAPAVIAGTPKHVRTNAQLVEALPLESEFGTAIILLNWSGSPIEHLVVTVPRARLPHTPGVSSANGAALTQALTSSEMIIGLRLDAIDVLLIE